MRRLTFYDSMSNYAKKCTCDEMSAGGSPSVTPGPGDDTTAKARNFQPNAIGNISPYSRSSVTQKVPDMLGKGMAGENGLPQDNDTEEGPDGSVDDPEMRSAEAADGKFFREQRMRTNDTIARINAKNAALWSRT